MANLRREPGKHGVRLGEQLLAQYDRLTGDGVLVLRFPCGCRGWREHLTPVGTERERKWRCKQCGEKFRLWDRVRY